MTITEAALPDLSSDYPLTDSQISDYHRNGHTLVRGLVSPDEIAAYRPLLLDAVEQNKREIRPSGGAGHLRQGLPPDHEPVGWGMRASAASCWPAASPKSPPT